MENEFVKPYTGMMNAKGKFLLASLYDSELKSKVISKRLADFRQRRQPELGKVHDPMKDTISHLSPDYTFGIAIPPDEYAVGHLIGSGKTISKSAIKKRYVPSLPAGIPTRHEYSEDHFHVHKTEEGEDTSVVLKITEDVPGGELNERMLKGFDLNHVFGVPTVREPRGHVAKKFGDNTVNSFVI